MPTSLLEGARSCRWFDDKIWEKGLENENIPVMVSSDNNRFIYRNMKIGKFNDERTVN